MTMLALYCSIGFVAVTLDCLLCVHDGVGLPSAAQAVGLMLLWPATVAAVLALLLMVLVIEAGIWFMGDV